MILADQQHPRLALVAPGHEVRCWLYHDEAGRPLDPDAPSGAHDPVTQPDA